MTAVLVIDLQVGMFDGVHFPPIYKAASLLANTERVLEAAHNGLPEAHWLQGKRMASASSLSAEANGAVFQKTESDSFSNEMLGAWLKSNGVNELDMCVAATVLSALNKGFKVQVVGDCHSTWDSEGVEAADIITNQNKLLKEAGATIVASSTIKFY
ncbi:Isochorismatase hydrolase [Rhizoclosmatium globosum]|uniref:Isochorismatase hydrolase n=1 Tax=Rhizoclosmatium globosum TaxID=329046 RepID=A0A1Y2CVM2_9FUNG|nr:Isochorismatase hydrolase [Rhizoclosmatium globosum]|eukprot:ORY51071.1 Isochorismatase hydrolase [Rhizoclosmatium globosum]